MGLRSTRVRWRSSTTGPRRLRAKSSGGLTARAQDDAALLAHRRRYRRHLHRRPSCGTRRTGRTPDAKILSTPDDPSRAVLRRRATGCYRPNGCDAGAVSYIVHGTTVATNAVLQRRLAPAAFVTTAGFRDLLEIARQVRPEPLRRFRREAAGRSCPRHLCFEVDERLDAAGAVVTPLDMGSVERVAERDRECPRRRRRRLPAACLPQPRARAGRRARSCASASPVSRSRFPPTSPSEFREFPRACTAIINAGLIPKSARYLQPPRRGGSRRRASPASRLVMQSNGGISDFRAERRSSPCS